VKTLAIATVASAVLAASVGSASAQYGDTVPITRNWRGELACPSNYVIRGGVCVSIYAGGGGYPDRGYGGGGYGRERNRDYGYRNYDYDDGPRRYRDGRGVVEPRLNYRGELQCPSNFVIRNGVCVSIYR